MLNLPPILEFLLFSLRANKQKERPFQTLWKINHFTHGLKIKWLFQSVKIETFCEYYLGEKEQKVLNLFTCFLEYANTFSWSITCSSLPKISACSSKPLTFTKWLSTFMHSIITSLKSFSLQQKLPIIVLNCLNFGSFSVPLFPQKSPTIFDMSKVSMIA